MVTMVIFIFISNILQLDVLTSVQEKIKANDNNGNNNQQAHIFFKVLNRTSRVSTLNCS